MKTKMGWACGMYWERRGAYRILVGKPDVRKPLGRTRLTWEDNRKMDTREVGLGYRLDRSGSG
jgi:hypothetical protein